MLPEVPLWDVGHLFVLHHARHPVTDDLKNAVQQMLSIRRESTGEETEVLIDRLGEREVIDLKGVVEARESTTLDDFQ